jgi:TolB-like protein/Tfp pilus assembly protein PilF
MNFFTELKRRNVYKVAVAYAVVAWLLIQAASILFPTFEAPGWVMKIFVIAIAAGFPVALIVAWAFELTPEGVKRTEDVTETSPRQPARHAWIYIIAVAGVLSIGLFFLGRYTVRVSSAWAEIGRVGDAPLGKSIAVLPFENRSEDKANAYFADGIQDEILTRLAKIADLKVISRTSTQRYKSSGENVRQIAQQLGVDHVLEGSVQKAGEQVRVTVQLIRATTDSHLWAETYDRRLTDIFAVESEIAETIARSLQAKLTPREQQAVAAKPTQNPVAYDAYLRGIDFESRPGEAGEDRRKAIEAFEEVVRLDPQFAEAWARLAQANATLYFMKFDASAGRQERARVALEMATRLAPTSPETLLANAYYRYHVQRDYNGAKELFEKIRRELPSNSEAVEALARIARRQTRWKDSIRLFEEAEKLNPRDAHLFMDRAWTFSMVRNYAATLQMIERAEAIVPGDGDVLENKAFFFQWTGDLKAARVLIEQIKDPRKKSNIETTQLVLERRYAEAAHLLEEKLSRAGAEQEADDRAGSLEWLGLLHLLEGDLEGAKQAYLEAKPVLERFRVEQPTSFWIAQSLASVEAGLGNKEAALREAERAMQVAAAADDPVFAPGVEETVARIEAQLGEPEAAITRLERLLPLAYGAFPLTQARLRIDPAWDPLRSHPRFKALVEGLEPKTVYQ